MRQAIWPWVLGVSLVAGYAVPYTLLAGIGRWSGAFLFWLIFGVLVWVTLSAAVMRWRTDASANLADEREIGS